MPGSAACARKEIRAEIVTWAHAQIDRAYRIDHELEPTLLPCHQ